MSELALWIPAGFVPTLPRFESASLLSGAEAEKRVSKAFKAESGGAIVSILVVTNDSYRYHRYAGKKEIPVDFVADAVRMRCSAAFHNAQAPFRLLHIGLDEEGAELLRFVGWELVDMSNVTAFLKSIYKLSLIHI